MKKYCILLFIVVFVMLVVMGCESTDSNNKFISQMENEINISGSTSVEKVCNGLAEEYMADNTDVIITYQAVGSTAGIKNTSLGVSMLGTASRELKEAEKNSGLKKEIIAYDGIAVIIHPDNNIKNLNLEQVKQIFEGEITNWKEVGGEDKKIVVVSREAGSGTRSAFEKIVDFKDNLFDNAILAEGNGNVQLVVSGNPQSIGYVSFACLNNSIKTVDIDGVKATIKNVLAKQYLISRPFILVYYEENINEKTKDFIKFILSDKGQKIVENKGAIPVSYENK